MKPDWLTLQTATDLLSEYGSPLWVYDLEHVQMRYHELADSLSVDSRLHYAIKANENPDVLKTLLSCGSGIEAVSPGACVKALEAGFAPEDIIVTCNAMTREEMRWYLDKGIAMNIDSMMQLRRFVAEGGKKCGLRINKGIGAGHHEHVITGGPRSKFGIGAEKLPEVREYCKQHGVTIVGLHQHIGSSFFDIDLFMRGVELLLAEAAEFDDLEYIDIGGGFGIPYMEGEPVLDYARLGKHVSERIAAFSKKHGKVKLLMEPGRYFVQSCGWLLCTVQDVKRTPHRVFVGLDTGMNHLIRPAMYGAYHVIYNISNPDGKPEKVTVVGNVCETSDQFAGDIVLPEFREDDIVAMAQAGAYGSSMSSNYNSRGKAAEVVKTKDGFRLSVEREQMWERL